MEALTTESVCTLLDDQLLRSLWHRLFLPAAVRRLWEGRFGDLGAAA